MEPSSRQTYLDWLRFSAIVAVVMFHSALPFVDDFWLIRNPEKSNGLAWMTVWLHRFRMPLLFFISGTVSWYMLQKKSTGGFVRLRLRRLLIPLVFGMLVIVPPQIYLERVSAGYHGSFWSYYPSTFTSGIYPAGNLGWHHLWFLAYLLVYDIVFAPVFTWLISGKGRWLVERSGWFAKNYRLYWLTLPGVILFACFSARFVSTDDIIHDYVFFPYWLFFLLMGFCCIANPLLMESVQRNLRVNLSIAVVSTLVLTVAAWQHTLPDKPIPRFSLRLLAVICAWTSLFAVVGLGKRYLTRRTPFLNYMNQALYPFYILHQLVIVWLAFYVVRMPWPVMEKYFAILLPTIAISVAVFHFVIRPVPAFRLLFGMQPKKVNLSTDESP